MRNPLASKFGQLLVILAQQHSQRLLCQVLATVNELRSPDQKSKSSYYRFFTKLLVTDDLSNDLTNGYAFAGCIRVILAISELIELQLLIHRRAFVFPYLVYQFNRLLSYSCVCIVGAENDGLYQALERAVHYV